MLFTKLLTLLILFLFTTHIFFVSYIILVLNLYTTLNFYLSTRTNTFSKHDIVVHYTRIDHFLHILITFISTYLYIHISYIYMYVYKHTHTHLILTCTCYIWHMHTLY